MRPRLDAIQLNLDELGHTFAILSADPARRGVEESAEDAYKTRDISSLDLHVVLVLQANFPLALRLHVLDRTKSLIEQLERRDAACQ